MRRIASTGTGSLQAGAVRVRYSKPKLWVLELEFALEMFAELTSVSLDLVACECQEGEL